MDKSKNTNESQMTITYSLLVRTYYKNNVRGPLVGQRNFEDIEAAYLRM